MADKPTYEELEQRIRELEETSSNLGKAQEALRESEERMLLAFRATHDGIWDWNMETDEVFYSTRWKTMLGYEEAEIEHHVSAWKRLLHPEDLTRALEMVASVMRGDREYVIEFRMRHKDGHYVDILSRGFPVCREPEGPVFRIVGTHFDLTELKRAEYTIKANEVMLRVQNELIELKNAALREVLEQLEIEKNKIQKNILSNIDELILPALNKFKSYRVSASQIKMLRNNFENLADSFGRKVSDKKFGLTPKEMEICTMIRSGCTNKDIAEQLHLSILTIERHRKHIRRKLGITKEKVNLQAYLQTL